MPHGYSESIGSRKMCLPESVLLFCSITVMEFSLFLLAGALLGITRGPAIQLVVLSRDLTRTG